MRPTTLERRGRGAGPQAVLAGDGLAGGAAGPSPAWDLASLEQAT